MRSQAFVLTLQSGPKAGSPRQNPRVGARSADESNPSGPGPGGGGGAETGTGGSSAWLVARRRRAF